MVEHLPEGYGVNCRECNNCIEECECEEFTSP